MADTRTVLVLSVAAAVALAGCTALGGGGGDEGPETRFRLTQEDGLTVSFATSQNKYFEDGQIVLDFSAQNTGQSTAENVEAQLFGASFLAGDSLDLSQTRLRGADEAAQQPGGIATATYQQRNPVDLRQGDVQPFPAGVRVMYDYHTEADADFRVVPRRGFEGTSALVETSSTAAPVQVDIEVQSPKPVSRSEDSDTVTVSIPVVARNVGDGKVVKNIQGERGQVSMAVSFPLASESTAKITDCGGSDSTDAQFSFPRGKTSRRVVCTAEISEDVFDTQLTIAAELDYTYFETTETMFEIEGLAGDQSGEGPGDEEPSGPTGFTWDELQVENDTVSFKDATLTFSTDLNSDTVQKEDFAVTEPSGWTLAEDWKQSESGDTLTLNVSTAGTTLEENLPVTVEITSSAGGVESTGGDTISGASCTDEHFNDGNAESCQ